MDVLRSTSVFVTGALVTLFEWLAKDLAGFATLLLVLVAIIQAWFFYRQLRFMRDALKPAQAAAEAAEKSASTENQSMVMSTRAWVFVGVEWSVHRGFVTIHAKNYGPTPAVIEEIWTKWVDKPPPAHDVKQRLVFSLSFVLGSAGDKHELFDIEMPKVFNGFMVGCVRYRDAFGLQRRSYFSYRVQDDLQRKFCRVCPDLSGASSTERVLPPTQMPRFKRLTACGDPVKIDVNVEQVIYFKRVNNAYTRVQFANSHIDVTETPDQIGLANPLRFH